MSKVVFVGNVPYNMGEEQLIKAFNSVGTVVGFRLVFDRDTGKPKGYGFCEFIDHETALSAMRNLHGVEVGGRPLRIDLADSDPFLEGKTTVRGEIVDMSETRAQWRERERERENTRRAYKNEDPTTFLASVPQGVQLAPEQKAEDRMTNLLTSMSPGQLMEVLAQMKAFMISHQELTRSLLDSNPQLGYALMRALVLNNIVDQSVLERMPRDVIGATTPAPASVPPDPSTSAPRVHYQPVPLQVLPPFNSALGMPSVQMPYHPAAPVSAPSMYPPPYMSAPPPAPHIPPAQNPYCQPPPPDALSVPQPVIQAPQIASAPPQAWDSAQQSLLMQVLQLTDAQINTLPAAEREQIHGLRQQYPGLV